MKNRDVILLICSVMMVSCLGRGSSSKGAISGEAQTGAVAVTNLKTIVLSDSTITVGVSDTIDLGSMGSGEIIEKNIEILNSGDKPLVLNSMRTNCGCITTEYDAKPLLVGERRTVLLRYNSGGQSGFQFKKLNINTSVSDKNYCVYVTTDVK